MPEHSSDLPMVKYLMECYFHQMWIDLNESQGLQNPKDYRHPLNELLELETTELVKKMVLDLNSLIALKFSEIKLESLLRDQLDGSINPPSRGMTYTQWIVEVRDYLKAGLKNK